MVKAADLCLGDAIRWCGHWGTIVDIEPMARASGRTGRWFTLDFEGWEKRLHWFDSEEVVTEQAVPAPIDGSSDA